MLQCSLVKRQIPTTKSSQHFPRTQLRSLRLGAHLRDVLLQGVGLSCASLSKPAADYVSALVDTAVVLGVRDTSLGRYTVEIYFLLVFSCQ